MKLWYRKRLLWGLAIALGIGVVFCTAFQFKLFYSTQLRAADFLFRAPGNDSSAQQANRIVVVAIDDRSLDKLGSFSSWPRSYHARLVDTLDKAKARVIVFDILFSEPTTYDNELASSVKSAGNVVLPIVRTYVKQEPVKSDKTIEYASFARPLKLFEESAAALGHANVLPDADGVVRRLPIIVSSGDEYEPALALAATAEYLQPAQAIAAPRQDEPLSLGGQLIPVTDINCMIINYTGVSAEKGASLPVVSYVDVLEERIDPEVFQDSIVIIGITAIGLGDTFWTPKGRMMSGVEIHANAIHTILSGNFLSPAPPAVTMLTILVLALLCSAIVLHFGVIWAASLSALLYVMYFLGAFTFFDRGIVLDMLYPPLATLFAFIGATLYRIRLEQSDKRELTKLFGRYIPSQIVDRLLVSLREGKLDLAGEQQEVTVMFADIRGFTSISDKVNPEELVTALNAYLSTIIEQVLKHDGMINKFGGDSIMAVWNVPTESPWHALSAIKAAVDAHRAIKDLQEKEMAIPKMNFGIGIETGKAVAGNMGSEDRLEYTVIGEAVNLASRITSATPGGKVWVGVETFESAKGYVIAKQLKPLTVKGKREPVAVYEIEDYVVDYVPRGNSK